MVNGAVIMWLTVSLLFAFGELLSSTFIFVWFCAGALSTMFLSIFIKSILWQTIIFIATSVILLCVGTKYLVNKDKNIKYNTNLQGLISKEGVVIKDIKPCETGIVKVRGEEWSAISEDNTEIKAEKLVEILDIEGVKLVVKEVRDNNIKK